MCAPYGTDRMIFENIGCVTICSVRQRSQRAQSQKRAQCCFWVFAIELQLDDSTLQAYSYGMGSVVRAQFGENTLDVAFDRVQRDLQMIGD
jgi:hypothetical protein